jgi:signal transduction histidine kinase
MSRADKSFAAFLSSAFHELSQNLTTLRGSLELAVLRKPTLASYRHSIEDALESADRLAQKLQTLRSVLDLGTPEGVETSAPLLALVRSTLADLQPLAQSSGAALVFDQAHDPEGRDDLWVRGDSSRLQQLLLLVLHSALERVASAALVEVSVSTASEPPAAVLALLFAEPNPKLGHFDWNLEVAERIAASLGGALAQERPTSGSTRLLLRLPLTHSAKPARENEAKTTH